MQFLTESREEELDLNVIGNNFKTEDVSELKKFLKEKREPMLMKELEFIVKQLKEMPLMYIPKLIADEAKDRRKTQVVEGRKDDSWT